ncbi:MAG: tol-pal system-associated acyl-CoA thioesterase [Alphaproteobacteria bacterium]|nr:tol-pal system-associated acyl-CoA thioesterase [Alphaproteobacteria bacterium]
MNPNKFPIKHFHTIRVYYEDTDATGRVYHASYLKFAERARTEMLREFQLEQSQIRKKLKTFFVVFQCNVMYLSPAFLDEDLTVHSHLIDLKRVRMIFDQQIWRQQECLAKLTCEIACINEKGRPTRIPDSVLSKLRMDIKDKMSLLHT